MKKKFHDVNPQVRNKMLDEFYYMVSEMKEPEDAKKFFKDLLTPGESVMIVYRIEIAKMLLQGFAHRDIARKLSVGMNTINSVNKWLYSGFGGYMKAIKNAENYKIKPDSIPKTEWDRIKKKYPAHFLIFNLIDRIKK